jgi:hypothetical protein
LCIKSRRDGCISIYYISSTKDDFYLHWIQEEEFFSHVDGFPTKPFPHSWRGKNGLYAAGFTRKGLMGTSYDAVRIAGDIADQWTEAFASPTAAHRSSDHNA